MVGLFDVSTGYDTPMGRVEMAHRGIYLLTQVHELGHSPPVKGGVAQVVLEGA